MTDHDGPIVVKFEAGLALWIKWMMCHDQEEGKPVQTTLLKTASKKEPKIKIPILKSYAWDPSSLVASLLCIDLTTSQMLVKVKR